MAVYKLGAVEARFAELIWENEPLPSNRLAKLAEQELGWKKSTTYTILKRLCERGLFQNEGGQVSSLVSLSLIHISDEVPDEAERHGGDKDKRDYDDYSFFQFASSLHTLASSLFSQAVIKLSLKTAGFSKDFFCDIILMRF